MLGYKSDYRFYPPPTGDLGRDRNARTVQFSSLLLASAISVIVILNLIAREPKEIPFLAFTLAGLVAALITNREGKWEWAAWLSFSDVLLTAVLLVYEARDGFRSNAMLLFPGMLLLAVMLLDRVAYMFTAGVVLLAVAALGIAETQGLTHAIRGFRSPTTYESIFIVDLSLLVFAIIGSRISLDTQSNVLDLRTTVDRLSGANLELKQTAEAWRTSEQRLDSVYNTVVDPIFHLAVESEGQFRFVSVNASFLRVTGLAREMVVGKMVNEVIPKPSQTLVLGKYRQAIEQKTAVLWEETSDYPTGRLTGVVSVVPIFDQEGTCTHLVGSVHDITERKRAEAALRQSEERLRSAERLANAGNWHWDLDADEVIWSDGMSRIFGQARDYPPSYDGFLQRVILQDRERLRRVLRDALADHSGFSGEVQIARPDGDLRTISLVGEPLIDEEGSLKAMFGAAQDITDLRRAQIQDFARQKLESLGTLAAGIAHDFNNLLGAVLVQAEVALMGLADGSNPEGELKTIRDVAVRGADIVRQLMTYAGKESAVIGLLDVSQTIREMLALLKVSASKHALLEVRLGQDLPFVRANAAELQQVVMNLVTNASDAVGHRDGVIRITTKSVKADQDSWAVSHGLDEGDYVQLEVSDTGCGIPPEMQARVFDPFFTTKGAGHGLGLSIIHGIVRSFNGAIRVISDPGKDTTFQILLPCAEAMAGEIGEATADRMESAGQLLHATVLVVEDEDSLRQAVVKMFRRAGLEVFEAADGSTAIDLVRANAGKIDLILLDMTIPGASSTEVMTETGTWPHIGVILTSAYSQEMLADALSKPQVRGFIRKPFRLADLMRTIRNTLRKE